MRKLNLLAVSILLSLVPVTLHAAESVSPLPAEAVRQYQPYSTNAYSVYGGMTASTHYLSFEFMRVTAELEFVGILPEDAHGDVAGAASYSVVNAEEFNSGSDLGCVGGVEWVAFKQAGKSFVRVSFLRSDETPADNSETAAICNWMTYRLVEP